MGAKISILDVTADYVFEINVTIVGYCDEKLIIFVASPFCATANDTPHE